MATRCCHVPVQPSCFVSARIAANCAKQTYHLPALPQKQANRLASSSPLFGSLSSTSHCSCTFPEGVSRTRKLCVGTDHESSGKPTVSEFSREENLNVRDGQVGAEQSTTVEDDSDYESDENSPAHWLQKWAEEQEQDMHRATKLAYSALSEGTCCTGTNHSMGSTLVMGLGLAFLVGVSALGVAEPAVAIEALGSSSVGGVGSFLAEEPANALSLPTWVIHVASVVEWVTAISLVWRYGDSDAPGRKAWKGLAWGMVPLLAGALCACTWHFFYNAPSLEGVVALQGFFTVLGNCTLWLAAFRIYQQAQQNPA